MQVDEPTSAVVLHAFEIQFREVTIGAGAAAQTATVSLDEASQTATLTVPKPLAKGATEIHVRFSGILNTQLRGFYISKTKLRKYAVTQFESTDARRAFPCFDEPAFKATFARHADHRSRRHRDLQRQAAVGRARAGGRRSTP